MNNLAIPNRIIKKIKRKAPCFSHGENFNRYPGIITEGHENSCQYKNVILYIQKGHNDKKIFFEKLLKSISKIQSSKSRKYRMFIFGIGSANKLEFSGKYFDLRHNIIKHKKEIINEFLNISNNNKCNNIIIPELFPKSSGKNIYTSRIKINKEDLLIVIGNKDEVFFSEDLQTQLKTSIRKRILLIEFNTNDIEYTFSPKELKFNLLTNKKNNTMKISRFFSNSNLNRIKKDFNFLIDLVNKSYGEYDFAIRDNYFNIYYKGNSLAKVEPKKDNFYKVSINSKFFDGTKADNSSFYTSKKDSGNIILSNKQLHPFFQKKHLNEFASRIKKVNNGEEIAFEQSLITDNLNREDIIIIDRQVTDTILKRKRLDLLALKQIEGDKYQFLVMEVKLGNNPELRNKVASQLNSYVKHIQTNFNDYKTCYEKHFEQKKELGLINIPAINKINIVEPVEGIILVGSYSGLAKKQIAELNTTFPHLKVKQFTNEI